MYCVGNLPDHVTRYNHKNQGRWMVMTEPPRRLTAWDVIDRVVIPVAALAIGAGLILTVLMILQGV